MPKFVVRLWLDLEVEAESEVAAREVGRKVGIEIDGYKGAEVYDTQVGDCWVREVTE
jgi:hypothetical protein